MVVMDSPKGKHTIKRLVYLYNKPESMCLRHELVIMYSYDYGH